MTDETDTSVVTIGIVIVTALAGVITKLWLMITKGMVAKDKMLVEKDRQIESLQGSILDLTEKMAQSVTANSLHNAATTESLKSVITNTDDQHDRTRAHITAQASLSCNSHRENSSTHPTDE